MLFRSNLMKEAFRETEGRELYDASKTWEKEFLAPRREAPRQARETAYERPPISQHATLEN